MRSYRLLLLSKGGLVIGTKSLSCLGDQEAIAAAEREARKCDYVEVWDGGRPVCICARPLRPSFKPAKLLRRCRSRLTRLAGLSAWQTHRDRLGQKHGL